MPRVDFLTLLLDILIFLLGAGIGSFLNVVIYRLPLGMSVNNPRRSFCPTCKKQIPWYRNLPLITWLAQRGKCAECGSKIAFRYFFVELLTGCLFYAVYVKYGVPVEKIASWGPMVLCYWIFTALLIAGTFIDLDHFILPHEITIGGLFAGLLGSFWVPQLMEQTEHGRAIVFSFLSACLGLGFLWSIVELGKLAFGRLSLRCKPPFLEGKSKAVCWVAGKVLCCKWLEGPVSWNLTQPNEEEPPVFKVGEEETSWLDIFTRPSDRLIIIGDTITVNDRTFQAANSEIKMETLRVQPKEGEPVTFKIEDVKRLEGHASQITIPREAMGFGDVLLLAMIGSFLGWKAVIFTVVAASFIGSLFGVIPRLIGKTEWTAKIPFGPYLAAGAMIWLFWGSGIAEWYLSRAGLI